ncbi:MAG: choice-of-anchor J domain-containing protein, partial [Rubrivivax sp.]
MTHSKLLTTAAIALALGGTFSAAQAQSFTQGFDGGGPGLPAGWLSTNNSTNAAPAVTWSVGTAIVDDQGTPVVFPQAGFSFALVNFNSVASGSGTISNWMFSPQINTISNGDSFSFYTTTVPSSGFPDRLELRLSTAGAGTNVGTTATSVGTFSTLLLSINPTLAQSGYPEDWTRFTATVSGLATPASGRIGFRYFVTDGGPLGNNSNIIGLDTF